MNLTSYLKPYVKINSKWNINIRAKTIELTEENIGESLIWAEISRDAKKHEHEKNIDQLITLHQNLKLLF